MSKNSMFWSPKKILSKGCTYNMVIGERSNGKTYGVELYSLKKYIETGEQFAIIRRWGDDFKGKRGATMFDSIVANEEIKKLTKGEWTDIYYYSSRWFLCRYEDDKRIVDVKPLAYGFSLSAMEHDKSTSYPGITTIIFDEFLTRGGYLQNEFVLFMNVISTIARLRTNIKIFMLGNTVNQYCPYFDEMGLYRVRKMNQGDIDVYEYGNSELKVAVEYCESLSNKGKKSSNFLFAFENPKLEMITTGTWEMDIYPHCPFKYKSNEIIYTYFIIFDNNILQCEIIVTNNITFTFIHRKTTPLKSEDNDLIYSTSYDPRCNWRRNMLNSKDNIDVQIKWYFITDRVYYQDNTVGEIVKNYLLWCKKRG